MLNTRAGDSVAYIQNKTTTNNNKTKIASTMRILFVADRDRWFQKAIFIYPKKTILKWLRFTWIFNRIHKRKVLLIAVYFFLFFFFFLAVYVFFRLRFQFWHSYREKYRKTPLTTAWFIANATIKLVIVLCLFVYVWVVYSISVCILRSSFWNPIELHHSFRSIFNAFYIKININKHKINSKMRQTTQKNRNNIS